jgi:hypothetical protein
MELIARNFECFPTESSAYLELCSLLKQCEELRFPFTIGETNSNQFTFSFDAHLKVNLLSHGALEAELTLPREFVKEYDFVFSFMGKRVVVEVEKANWEKILYDFLKFHMYFRNGADFATLFLPKNYAHKNGQKDLFDCAKKRYQQCVQFGFGTPDLFDRILLVGYQQFALDGSLLSPAVRHALIAGRKSVNG